MTRSFFYSIFFILLSCTLYSQEGVRPLRSNINYFYKNLQPPVKQSTGVSAQKSATAAGTSLYLPFEEDFYYSPTSNYPDPAKWEDSLVYVNSGMAIAPLSIGVATFDGLNKHGYPYNPTLTNLTLSQPADRLTSKPINLHTSATQSTLQPSSNIALSFYYQARGNGDPPEQADSLILDFFRPYAGPDSVGKPDTSWKRVWFALGNTSSNTNDTAFKRAFIRIKDTAYFHDGFRFRFRNYASLTGNFDHWHLDYIVLNQNRGDSLADTVRNDVTFAGMATSFLSDYSEMPVQQYENFEMAPYFNNRIRNNSAKKWNMNCNYQIFDVNNVPLFPPDSGSIDNVNPFWKNTFTPPGYGYDKVLAHARPKIKNAFVVTPPTGAEFHIKHYLTSIGADVANDVIPQNDTILHFQRFRNLYAFDDGSAEAGYYVEKPGSTVAVKIRLNSPDSLKGLRIYFDPAGNVSTISNTLTSVYNFSICVWTQGSNGAPDVLIMKDSITNHPAYIENGFKEVPEYKLRNQKLLSPGVYFIGIQQASSILTFGFDRNYNHNTSLYFNSGTGWKQSEENGSIMMQPVFGTYIAPVGIEEVSAAAKDKFLVYPNPSSDQFTIRSSRIDNNTGYQLFNAMGQLVREGKVESPEHAVSTAELGPGMYILLIKNKEHAVQQQKIIVQH